MPETELTKEICYMKLSLLFVAAIVILAGCATGPTYESQVLDRPLPTTQEERMRECNGLRAEIARQQSFAQYGASTATSPMMAMAYQSAARNHIAALESRAANVQCQAAFSSVVASPAAQPAATKGNMDFDQCFSRCQQLTSRTKDQCFDACK